MKITIAPSRKPQPGESADTVPSIVTVEHPYDDLDICSAMRLVKQALIAWGYDESNVEDYFGEDA